jgi:RNase P subunit RPR2
MEQLENKMSEYTEIKNQIKFITGKYAIICPACKQTATASVSGAHKVNDRTTRAVKTICRHCSTSYTFQWK